tara:strand:+ start:437 stop:913 length:477 start_codon:yes stop_codon:yes gene_type:complete
MDYLWYKRKNLIDKLQKDSKLFHSPIHGFKHWRTVEKNGLYLSQFNNGNPKIISYFAYFHDCMRVNEHIDNGHGYRGGRYAMQNKELLDLSDEDLRILYRACAGHTGGVNPSCDTIACCWDADRLDIRRVDIELKLKFFNTKEARRMVKNQDFSAIDN